MHVLVLFTTLFCLSFPGKVGDFEVEAKWSWKLQVNPLNVLLIASSLLVVMLSILGCAYLYMLSRELSKFTSEAAEGLKELKELKDRVAELTTWQSAISEEMKELREHSEPATNQSESGRFRRSVLGRGKHLAKNITLRQPGKKVGKTNSSRTKREKPYGSYFLLVICLTNLRLTCC